MLRTLNIRGGTRHIKRIYVREKYFYRVIFGTRYKFGRCIAPINISKMLFPSVITPVEILNSSRCITN